MTAAARPPQRRRWSTTSTRASASTVTASDSTSSWTTSSRATGPRSSTRPRPRCGRSSSATAAIPTPVSSSSSSSTRRPPWRPLRVGVVRRVLPAVVLRRRRRGPRKARRARLRPRPADRAARADGPVAMATVHDPDGVRIELIGVTARARSTVLRSETRILTTHAGSLPRPRALAELHGRRSRGEEVDAADLERGGERRHGRRCRRAGRGRDRHRQRRGAGARELRHLRPAPDDRVRRRRASGRSCGTCSTIRTSWTSSCPATCAGR